MNKMMPTLGCVALIAFSANALSTAEFATKSAFNGDQGLTMRHIFQQSIKRFPLLQQHAALEYEAVALKERGDSLIANAPALSLRYQNDDANNNIGLEEYEAGLQLPLWRWGQRSAGKRLGVTAREKAASYMVHLQYKVAGLLRSAIWSLRLKQNEMLFSYENHKVSAKLVTTVRRRVELGGLAKADLLLAESDLMTKQASLEEATTQLEVARRQYRDLTSYDYLPAEIDERLNGAGKIGEHHPLLALKTDQIKQLEAQLNWVRASGSGQPLLTLGVRNERSDRQTGSVDSLGATINIPFGGSVHKEPAIAAINSQLIQAKGEYVLLSRNLNQNLYAIAQRVEMDRRTLKLAKARNEIAQKHLKMSNLGFQTGEITLIDLLKIQEISQQAALQAAKQKIVLQHDIARHNQAAGVFL